MTVTTAQKRATFRALHQQGCFILPNPWDAGSARMLQHLGFAALASTSSGFAWTTGRPDYAVTRADALAHFTAIAAAVDLPINADFEACYANDPEGVVESVTLCIATGVAGLSIEDRDVARGGRLYDKAMAIERLRAARSAVDSSGADVMLVARTEGILDDPSAVSPAIDKLVAFAAEGADCLYAPGVWKKADIAAMVKAVAPKPLNVLVRGSDLTLADLAELGVRRISVGGGLAGTGWGTMVRVAKELKAGSFGALQSARMPNAELNRIFAEFL